MKAQIVSFHCVLKNKLGQVISSSFNHDVINQTQDGSDRLTGLVAGLQGVKKGEKRQVAVLAEHAYGLYDPSLVVEAKRSDFLNSKYLEVGAEVLRAHGPRRETKVFRVVQLSKTHVVLDGNHPLAGQDLIYDIEVVSARDACAEDFGPPEQSPGDLRVLH